MFSRTAFDYFQRMPPRDRPIFKNYTRLRAVEEAIFETLADVVPDEAVDEVAARVGVVERGDALYDHPDHGTLLDLTLYGQRIDGQTTVERHFAETKPAPGSDEHTVLTAMLSSRTTLLRLGAKEVGVGLRVEDLLFGGDVFLADPVLSQDKSRRELVVLTRLLAFDGFVMTPCTSYLDFEPALARLLAAGLPRESTVPMAERYAPFEARRELAEDLTHMAFSHVDSVKQALVKRFAPDTTA